MPVRPLSNTHSIGRLERRGTPGVRVRVRVRVGVRVRVRVGVGVGVRVRGYGLPRLVGRYVGKPEAVHGRPILQVHLALGLGLGLRVGLGLGF